MWAMIVIVANAVTGGFQVTSVSGFQDESTCRTAGNDLANMAPPSVVGNPWTVRFRCEKVRD